MKKKIKVSIIVPVYNVEKYLKRCMDSLLRQTLKDIEIILVDDGSPDRCPQICDEYALNDSRIRVIHKKNEGLGYARNSGIEIASGEYLAFVDSDDFVEDIMFMSLYKKAIENKLDVVYCGFNSYKNGNIIYSVNEERKYTQYNGEDCQSILHGMICNCGNNHKIVKYDMSVWHGIYRRDLLRDHKITFCSERHFCSEDIIFHIDLIKRCNSIGFIPNAYYYYCHNDSDSLTKKYRTDRLEKHDILFKEILRRVRFMQYKFNPEDAINLFLLKIRYDITIIASYNFSRKEQLKIISDIVNSNILKFWTKRINWFSLPLRYIIFYILVKMKSVNILYYIINKR